MEVRRRSGKCKWRKPCAVALAVMLTVVSMGSWSGEVLAAGGYGNEEDRVPVSEVPSSTEWLPVGDMEEISVEALSQEEAREAGLLESQQIQRLPNSRIRAASPVTVPGGTTYGYDWIRSAANTGSDAAILQGLYEAFAKSAEAAYYSEEDYLLNAENNTYYGQSVDVSSLGLAYGDAGKRLVNLAMAAFTLDNPQYYMVQGSSYTYYPDRIINVKITLRPSYASAAVRSVLKTTMESKYQEYANFAATGSSIYDKVRLVHDKMLAERDYSYVNGVPDDSDAAHTIVGVMDTSTAGPVCESFADAFAYILNRLEIDCVTVLGQAGGGGDGGGGHAWSLVQMEDGKYYYTDSTWDNRDNTKEDTENLLNDVEYKYFLAGSDNTDFGVGTVHAAADTNHTNGYYLYGLPGNISSTDYVPSNPSAYLTDNGRYGTDTKTAADNYDYVIGKSSTLLGKSIGSKEGNTLTDKVETEKGIGYIWNKGPYTFDRKSAVALYRWDYDSKQQYVDDKYTNPVDLVKGVDYTITKTEPIDNTVSRVWLQGAGSFKGIDFVLVKKAAVISSVGLLGFTLPALGAVPQAAGDLTAADSSKYQVTSLTWVPSAERYNGSKVYQATVELTAKAGYYFDNTSVVSVGASQAGDLSGVTMSTPVVGALSDDGEQNTLTFDLTFPQTAADLGSVVVRDKDGNIVDGQSAQTLLIPVQGGEDAVAVYSAQVLGTDGKPYKVNNLDAGVTMTAKLSNGESLPSGITFAQSGNQGTLTVTSATAAGSYMVKLTVTSADAGAISGKAVVNQNVSVTVERAASVPQKIIIAGGASTLTIPTDDTEVVSPAFTRQILDQYSTSMSNGEGSWQVIAPEGGSLTGVSIDTAGKVTLTQEVKEAVADETGKIYQVVYTDTASGISGMAELTIRRAAPVLTSLALYHDSAFDSPVGAADTLAIPLTGENDKVYYTKVMDQYGTVMTGQEVSLTFATEGGGVTFDGSAGEGSGKVSVSSNAQDQNTYTLTAAAGGKTAGLTITVRKVQVDWSGVEVQQNMIYGESKASAVSLPQSGTAAAGAVVLEGNYTIAEADTLLPSGNGTITVKFTVTTQGSFQNAVFDKSYSVSVAPKPIQVTADDQSREYGLENSPFTYAVPQGALVGEDSPDSLGLVLTSTATKDSIPGTYDITKASQANTNYAITVTPGSLTVTKAVLTLTGVPASLGAILASDQANQTEEDLIAAVQEKNPSLTAAYAGGAQTTSLQAVWTLAQGESYDPKGGTYSFTAELTPGNQTLFTYDGDTASLSVTVTPVTGTATPLALASVMKSKAQVLALTDLAADLGLAGSVAVQYDNGVESAVYEVTSWTPNLEEVKEQAQAVTDEKSVSINLMPNAAGIPAWATIDLSALKTQLQITNKYPVGIEVTAPNGIIYGETLGDPLIVQNDIGNGTDAQPAYTITYVGTTKAGISYQSEDKPTQAGTYVAEAVLVSDNYSGKDTSEEFTIAQKQLTQGMLTIDPSSYVFTGSDIVPNCQVSDTAGITASDYSLSYRNALNVGTGTVELRATATGNYTGTIQQFFDITKAPGLTVATVVREHGTVGTGSTVQGSIDLDELLPADKGTPVGYEILSRDASGGDVSGGDVSDGNVSEGDFSEDADAPLGAIVLGSDSIDENGAYHYTTTVTDTPAETKVTIKVTMGNYQDTTLTLLVRLVSKQVPMGQPLTTAIVYGQSLSESVLTGTMKNSEGNTIEGSFAWKAPDTLPSRGQNGYAWIFTPADTNLYLPAEGIAAVEVKKAVPQGEPSFTMIEEEGKTLADAGLTGTFTNIHNGQTVAGNLSWEGGDAQAVTPGTPYTWVFTPQDGINYETIVGTVVLYPATYQIAISAGEAASGTYQFPAAEVGYGAQTGLLITVKNTGNSPTDVLDLALSDTQGFILSAQRLDSLAAGETGSFLVTPAQGLSAGTYTAQVTVKGEDKGIQGSLQISFTVNPKTGGSEEGDKSGGGDEPELQLTQETVDLFQGLSEYIQSEVTDKDGNPVSVEQAFGGKSVEIRFAEDQTGDSQVAYLLGISADNVFPFSISLYVKGTNDLIQPGEGYAVKIRLPLPEQLVDQRDTLHVARVVDGQAQILPHTIMQINGQYVIEFLTDHFSTYAFVLGATNSGTGDSGSNNNGSGSENGNSSKNANSASGTEPDQVGTSPKTGDIGNGLQPQPIKDGKALLTVTSESQEKSAVSDILRLTIIAVAAGIAIAGIVSGMVLLMRKKGKKH